MHSEQKTEAEKVGKAWEKGGGGAERRVAGADLYSRDESSTAPQMLRHCRMATVFGRRRYKPALLQDPLQHAHRTSTGQQGRDVFSAGVTEGGIIGRLTDRTAREAREVRTARTGRSSGHFIAPWVDGRVKRAFRVACFRHDAN